MRCWRATAAWRRMHMEYVRDGSCVNGDYEAVAVSDQGMSCHVIIIPSTFKFINHHFRATIQASRMGWTIMSLDVISYKCVPQTSKEG